MQILIAGQIPFGRWFMSIWEVAANERVLLAVAFDILCP